jgi:endo-1,4-beta-D-glucanase Y
VTYTAGSITPDHLDQQALDRAVQDYYDAWKARYIRQECGDGRYILFTTTATPGGENTISISEGHGYGMLITVLMAGYDPQAQTIFDGMLRFFKDHPSANSPHLMAWKQVQGCTDVEPGNTGSASDGDMDIAYALLLADQQWGSQGEIDYRQEARGVIQALKEQIVNPQTHTLLLGDWVLPDETKYYFSTRTSDFMPGHLRAYSQASGDPAWQQVLDRTYQLLTDIHQEYSPQTGLLPDFIVDLNHTPRPAEAYFLENDSDGWYGYNACRDPWRLGVDYLLTGDRRALVLLHPLNAWIQDSTGGHPAVVKSGYHLDGKSPDERDYLDLAFGAPLSVAAMAEGENQAWLNASDLLGIHPSRMAGIMTRL